MVIKKKTLGKHYLLSKGRQKGRDWRLGREPRETEYW